MAKKAEYLETWWESNKGFKFEWQDFMVQNASLDDIKNVIEERFNETRENAEKTLECWKKNDPDVTLLFKVDYTNSDMREELQKYSESLKLKKNEKKFNIMKEIDYNNVRGVFF